MKRLLTAIGLLAICIPSLLAWNLLHYQIGDLYYNIDTISLTAEVTSQYADYPLWRTAITTAQIPASVTYNNHNCSVVQVGNSAFSMCEQLASVTMEEGIASIEENAFIGCYALTSVVIPNSVTHIADDAFRWCHKLPVVNHIRYADTYLVGVVDSCLLDTSFTIKEGTRFIANLAFNGCSNLASIDIPNTVISIGESAFACCNDLASVTLGNNVKSIEPFAFSYCPLTELTIPASLVTIGDRAFSDCEELTVIRVQEGNPVYDSRSNCNALIESATNTLILGCRNSTVPEGITAVGDYAFRNCMMLQSLVLPEGVTSIGKEAFYWCYSLKTMDMPSTITFIDERAFGTCSNLLTMTCRATALPELGDEVFDGVNFSKNRKTLYVPASAVETYKAAAQWKEFPPVLPIPGTEDIDIVPQQHSRSRLFFINGHIFILRADHTYTLNGQEVKQIDVQ